MWWDHGYGMGGMGWGWIWVVLLVLLVLGAIAALIVLLVKAFSSSGSPSTPATPGHGAGPAQGGTARAIAEERLARGELTPDQFREIVRALEDGSGRKGD